MENLVKEFVRLFPNAFGEVSPGTGVPPAVFTEILRDGEIVICEYFATAEPAGLMVTAPRSPPSAVNALPMAMVLADPS